MADLHPVIAEQLREEAAANRPPIHTLSIDAARDRMHEDSVVETEPRIDVADTAEFEIDGPDGNDLPVRSYWPAAADRRTHDALPILCWYHGGGFALGDLDTTDTIARVLTSEVGAIVVVVDYRLAPEHPFPAGVEDCYATLKWVADYAGSLGGDPERIAIGGGSAGGGLAVAVAQMARDRNVPDVAHQVAICPVTTDDQSLPSRRENASGYGLTTAELDWYHDMYVADEMRAANPYAYPLKACDLSDLPPATVITAGFDPLRDDGDHYADRLDAAGVSTTHRRFDGVTHGFFGMLVDPAIDPAEEAIDIATADLRAAFD